MDLTELKADMDERFGDVDQRFAQVDQRFARVDDRFQELIDLILSEGERTRRHFDVVAEQMKSERNFAIDKAVAVDERTGRLTASNAADHVEFSARLDDHEARLAELEQKPAVDPD